MGAYTSLPFVTSEDWTFAYEKILQATASAMVAEGLPLSGVLYGGLMKTPQGIKVIEFNARFGDPETEVVLPLLESDIYDIFHAVAVGEPLPELAWRKEVTMGVVLASKGYPGSYSKGAAMELGELPAGCRLYHMGTALKDGSLVTAGGRVIMSVASAPTLPEARTVAYKGVEAISCDNLFWRRDIAQG